MTRKSYEQHRAGRLLSPSGRRTSVIESETDAESLASYSTFQSNYTTHTHTSSQRLSSPRLASFSSSNNAPNGHLYSSSRQHNGLHLSPSAGPSRLRESSPSSIHGLPPSPGLDSPPRQRAFSSSSSHCTVPIPRSHLKPPSLPTSSNGRRVSSGLEEDKARRRRRREERVRKSTLRGEAYDSPLRSVIRWTSTNGWSGWSLAIGLGVVLVQRVLGILVDGVEFENAGGEGRGGAGWKRVGIGLGLEICLVWTGIISWVIGHGRQGGRSWRSQLTGIMTLLLSPLLTTPSYIDISSIFALGLSIWSLSLFSQNRDTLAIFLLAMNVRLESSGWWYLPVMDAYILGKSVWLGQPRGLIQVVKCLMAAVPALPPSIYTTILPARLALYNSTGFLTFLDPKPPTATTQASLWSALGKTFRIASFLSPASIERVSTVLTVLSIAPSLIIILYASLSIGQSSPSSTSPPPTIRLLLPALFTFTLGYYLFSTTATPTALPRVLVPLGLVMSLRGGKETGLGENETWELGVLLNNLASVSQLLSFTSTNTGVPSILVRVISTMTWSWVIGYKPWAVQSSILRRGGYIAYITSTLALLITLIARHFTSNVPSAISDTFLLLHQAVLVFALGGSWVWGMRKLIEGSWAISGLTLTNHSTHAKGKKME